MENEKERKADKSERTAYAETGNRKEPVRFEEAHVASGQDKGGRQEEGGCEPCRRHCRVRPPASMGEESASPLRRPPQP